MTLDNKDMTQDEKRIKIAEACGWQRVDQRGGAPFAWKNPSVGLGNGGFLPDYLNDLNAMHEAEKVLSTEQVQAYAVYLVDMCETLKPARQPMQPQCTWHATAAQRAEAFGKTLNLW